MKLQGITSGLAIAGIGTAIYSFRADDQSTQSVMLPHVLYVPSCLHQLLCPRHMVAHTSGAQDRFNFLCKHGVLTINDTTVTVSYHKHTGLPMLPLISAITEPYGMLTTSMPIASDPSIPGNLTPGQQVTLILHVHFNHIHIKGLSLIRDYIEHVVKLAANYPDPICHACQMGKAHCWSHTQDKRSISTRPITNHMGFAIIQVLQIRQHMG